MLDRDPRLQNQLLHEQELEFQELVGACMRQEGFEYFPVDDTAEVEAAADAYAEVAELGDFDRRRGLVSVAFAKREGFGLSMFLERNDAPSFARPENLNLDYIDGLGPEEQAAYGRTLGPCEESAKIEVGFDQVYTLIDVAEEVKLEVDERLSADSAFSRLVTGWVACYAESGGWFVKLPETPLDLYSQVAEQVYSTYGNVQDLGDIRTLEFEATLASARCAEGLGYAETLDDIYERFLSEELVKRGLR